MKKTVRVTKSKRGLWPAVGLAGLLAGCGTTNPPTLKVDSGAALSRLQIQLSEKFPEAKPFDQSGASTPLNRSLAFEAWGDAAHAHAASSFTTWCKSSRGALYEAPLRGQIPTRVRDDISAAELRYRNSAPGRSQNLEVSACEIAGQTFTMASGADANRRRMVAWFTPDETEQYRSAARAQRDAADRQRRTEEERIAREKRIQFLSNSPLGTQTTCSQMQLDDQVLSAMTYRCDQHQIQFGELNRHGWRVVSQSIIPEPTLVGLRMNRVTLLIEKVH